MPKVVYKAFSVFEFIKMLFLRGCMLVAAGYCFAHFEENPVVISVAILLCLALVIFIGDDRIIVYEDRVVEKDSSLAAYWFSFKHRILSKPDVFASGVISILNLPTPRKAAISDNDAIFFELKDGNIQRIETTLAIDIRKNIVQKVNLQLREISSDNSPKRR